MRQTTPAAVQIKAPRTENTVIIVLVLHDRLIFLMSFSVKESYIVSFSRLAGTQGSGTELLDELDDLL
jgi:hypothetical protein